MSFPGFALSGTSACRRRPLPGPFIYRSSLTSSRCLPAPRAAPAGGASRAERVTAVGARGRHVRLDRREAVRPPAPPDPRCSPPLPPPSRQSLDPEQEGAEQKAAEQKAACWPSRCGRCRGRGRAGRWAGGTAARGWGK